MYYVFSMDPAIKYRGKTIHADDVSFIKGLIAENPNDSRFALSVKLCKAWNWVQLNGQPRDMVCRGLMLALHRAGHIELPTKRLTPANPLAKRPRPAVVEVVEPGTEAPEELHEVLGALDGPRVGVLLQDVPGG